MTAQEYAQFRGVPQGSQGGQFDQMIAQYKQQSNMLPSIIASVEDQYRKNPESVNQKDLEYFNELSKKVRGQGLAGYEAESTLDDAIYGFTNTLAFNALDATGLFKPDSELTDAERRAKGIGSGLGFAAGLAVPIAGWARGAQGAVKGVQALKGVQGLKSGASLLGATEAAAAGRGAGLLKTLGGGLTKAENLERKMFMGKTALGTAGKGAVAGAAYSGFGAARDEYGEFQGEDAILGALTGAATGAVAGGVLHKVGSKWAGRASEAPELTGSGALSIKKGMPVEEAVAYLNKHHKSNTVTDPALLRIEGMMSGKDLSGANLQIRNHLAKKSRHDLTDIERVFLEGANEVEKRGILQKQADTIAKLGKGRDAETTIALADLSKDDRGAFLKAMKGLSAKEQEYFTRRLIATPDAERAEFLGRAARVANKRAPIVKARAELAKKIEPLVPLRKGKTPITKAEEASLGKIADSVKAKKIKQKDLESAMETLTAAQQRSVFRKIAKGANPEDLLNPISKMAKRKARVARYADHGGSPAATKKVETQIAKVVDVLTDAEEKELIKATSAAAKLRVVKKAQARIKAAADAAKAKGTEAAKEAAKEAAPEFKREIDFSYSTPTPTNIRQGLEGLDDLETHGSINL